MTLAAVALLLLPGLALVLLCGDHEDDLLGLLAGAGAVGMAVWVVGFWVLRALPLGLGGMALLLDGAALLALALMWRRARRALAALRLPPRGGAVLAVLAALALLRLYPYAAAPVAPGMDMAMHSYMARLIYEADGVPASYLPLLPLEEFGAYAAGLPTLGALLARLSGVDAARGALLAACLSHLWLALVVLAYLRRRAGPGPALVAMLLVTVGTRDPQQHFDWGGNPTVLSLLFVAWGLLGIERLEAPGWRRRLAPAALALAAAPLAHSVIPYALVYVLPPVLLLRHWRLPLGRQVRLAGRGLLLAGAAGLLLLPYLLGLDLQISPAERQWIRDWQLLPMHVPPGPRWALPITAVLFIGVRLGGFHAAVLGLALAARRWLRCPPVGEELLWVGLVLLLVCNALVWWLPGSYAIYPDRVMLLAVLPLGRILAATLEGLALRLEGVAARGRRLAYGASVVLLAGLLGGPAYLWWFRTLRDVSVTDDDLAAMRWISGHTAADALFENNYGDAGTWIPALAFRPVLGGHVNVVYLDEFAAWKRTARPTHLYIGARRVTDVDSPFSEQWVRSRGARYREVFRSGRAVVYRITGP